MSNYSDYFEKQLKNKDFKKIHDENSLEYEIMRAMIKARIEEEMMQKELAEKSGIRQSNISRIENGDVLPTLKTLEAIAKGLNKKLVIQFE